MIYFVWLELSRNTNFGRSTRLVGPHVLFGVKCIERNRWIFYEVHGYPAGSLLAPPNLIDSLSWTRSPIRQVQRRLLSSKTQWWTGCPTNHLILQLTHRSFFSHWIRAIISSMVTKKDNNFIIEAVWPLDSLGPRTASNCPSTQFASGSFKCFSDLMFPDIYIPRIFFEFSTSIFLGFPISSVRCNQFHMSMDP